MLVPGKEDTFENLRALMNRPDVDTIVNACDAGREDVYKRQVDTWMFFKWIFKTFCAVLIGTNTWNIVMGIFDERCIRDRQGGEVKQFRRGCGLFLFFKGSTNGCLLYTSRCV